MSVECLLDTNVLVYAAAGQEREVRKRERARDLLAQAEFGLSAQVLQEFYVTVVHKIAVPLSPAEAVAWIEQLEAFPCIAIDSSLVKVAAVISRRFRISYWDGAILAAAEALGAGVVYSEDLSSGQRYGAIRVVNPFI
ncbi:MAG: PIN domain-containing protein [bacterium]